MELKEKVISTISNVKTYWKTPMKGRYMPFREIAAYSGGGIGAYMIITIATACLLSTGNTFVSSTLAVDATDMYILYVIAILANIPMTGLRASIIDNTRNKAGKYRPYIITMGIPSAIICIVMVWFPYNKLEYLLPDGEIFGESYAYVAKCALILIFNLFLHFFYYFFYDAYENLIHVLSSNSQERADVASVKSVVYSFAPTVVNLITPIIAQHVFHTNSTDIRVYRLLYPILAILGMLLCIVIYKNTEEKIIQAKTHVIKIRFIDALREVSKNKYFWIISLASWIGFLEQAYQNILYWLYNYGGTCSGTAYGLINTIYGNASLWGMLFAPFCIKKWGKKSVLVVTNLFNIVFILMMLPFTQQIDNLTIWLVLGCLYLNAFMGSFAHILNPAIQADIRDYQQYKSGERIDGMFSAVGTIGTVVTLLTSSVLPTIYEKGGITKENAAVVTSNPNVLSRVLGDGKTVGQILSEQLANGQNNYTNAYSALYDMDILSNLLHVLIIVSAIGALMNVIPYYWYDFNERKQKSIIRVLKIRAMFEDYSNGALTNKDLIETVDIINKAKDMVSKTPKTADKKSYKSIHDKAKRKEAKMLYAQALEYNEEIEISKFIMAELNKYSNPCYSGFVNNCKAVCDAGFQGLNDMSLNNINLEISAAKAMPKKTAEEKDVRELCLKFAQNKKYAYKEIKKQVSNDETLQERDYTVLDNLYEDENKCDEKLKALYQMQSIAKKEKDYAKLGALKDEIKLLTVKKKEVVKSIKIEEKRMMSYERAVKPYTFALATINQMNNYSNFEEIADKYEQAKAEYDAEEMQKELKLKSEI